MDKYEYNMKLEQIKKLIRKKDYATASRIADTIDWYKVKNNQTIVLIADVYEASGRYDQAKINLKLAYDRSGLGRQIAYKLVKICIKCGELEEAEDYYDDFVSAAPRDISKYILQYELAKAKGEPLDKQIAILEQYLEEDMDDRWAFELAKLYHKSGQRDKCIEQCDTIMLWFSDGKYVEKAMDLKMIYTPLTKSQQDRYETRWREKSAQNNIKIEEIKVKEVDVSNQYNTQNIQNALKESMDELFRKERQEKDEEDSIFKPMQDVAKAEVEEQVPVYDEADESAVNPDDYIMRMAERAEQDSEQEMPGIHHSTPEEVAGEQLRKQEHLIDELFPKEPEDALGDTKVFRTTRSIRNMGDTKIFSPRRINRALQMQNQIEHEVEDEIEQKPYIVEEKTIKTSDDEVLADTEAAAFEETALEEKLEVEEEVIEESVSEEVEPEEEPEAEEEVIEESVSEDVEPEEEPEAEEEVIEESVSEDVELEGEPEVEEEVIEENVSEDVEPEEEPEAEEIISEDKPLAPVISLDDFFDGQVDFELHEDEAGKMEEAETDEVPESEENFEEELEEEETEEVGTDEASESEEDFEEELEEEETEEAGTDEVSESEEDFEEELEEEETEEAGTDEVSESEEDFEEELEESEIGEIEEMSEPEEDFEEELEESEIGEIEEMPEPEEDFEEELEESEIEETPELEEDFEEELEESEIGEIEEVPEPEEDFEEELEESEIGEAEEVPELEEDFEEEPEESEIGEIEEVPEPEEDFEEEPEESEIGEIEEMPEPEEDFEEESEEDFEEEPEEVEPVDPFETITDLRIDERFISDAEEEAANDEQREMEQQVLSNAEIKEVMKDFISKYSGVQSLDKQMLKTLQNVIVNDNCNIFIMGDAKSGKTSLGIDIIKVVNKIKQNNNRRIAKISADKLNGKDMSVYFDKLEGSDLFIEHVTVMDSDTVRELARAIRDDKDNRIVVIEDEKINADRFIERNPAIQKLFVNIINVKQNKIRDWVAVAEKYAEEQGYEIDEIGTLALHAKIDQLYGVTLVIQKTHVESIIDNAIRKAEKGGLFKKLFGKKKDKILSEEHFN